MTNLVVQGRRLGIGDVAWLRDLIATNAAPHRTGLSRKICELWNWRTPSGRLKDIAARSLLRKLEQRGLITLPDRLTHKRSGQPKLHLPIGEVPTPPLPSPASPSELLTGSLTELQPLRIDRVDTPEQRRQAIAVLRAQHYLGFNRSVGENVGYLVFDSRDRLLAVAWFGAAAWKAADRDRFIGWTPPQREQGLAGIANNARFLILSHVRVPHLASHVLVRLTRRLRRDWIQKYGHPVVLLETFIEEQRFRGTCYQAANWIVVGRTKGRSRQDRHQQLSVPPKLIALLPLERHWRRRLFGNCPP